MKRILLTSTAVAGLIALAAPGAMAQVPAGKFQVTIGGTSAIEYGFSDSNAARLTGHEFRNDTEVHVRANATADNGLQYGVHIEIESTGNNAASALDYDEAGIYVAGSFGRIEAGDEDGASDFMAVYAPAVGIGQLDGDFDLFTTTGCGTNCGIGNAASVTYFKVPDSSDSTKVTYVTPAFSGFQAGISYTPQRSQGDSVVVGTAGNSGYTDWVEGGLLYKNTFSGVGVKAGGTFSTAQDGTVGGRSARGGSIFAWQLGAQLSYAGFGLGGSYVDQGNVLLAGAGTAGANGLAVGTPASCRATRYTAQHSFQVGGTYETGPVGVAVQYGNIDTSCGDIDAISVGGNYVLAPGLQLAADYVHWTNKSQTVVTNATTGAVGTDDGDVFLVMTKITF
ncbi:MAG: porin [Azospirillum sp.]|nr:porin [Azospirillum sp.]